MTEINITPFVDVMLVLLVIFMVTTPLMQSGIAIDLPKENVGALEIQEENIVSLRKDGAMFFNDKRVTARDLNEKLKKLVTASPKAQVYLRADKGLPYGAVMKAMGAIKQAGVERLGMVTEMPTDEDKGK
ncbi:MAG: protein TolR [Nitrospinae bacterium]|nr:protein TolR [Nitrospinota bacterium]MBF0633973.1 protein TolR [Nitrospinota bacterium]